MHTLADLETATGISPRTIRYYISIGLMPSAQNAGRNATYTDEHLERLQEIQKLKAEGLSLDAIRHRLFPDTVPSPLPPVSTWQVYQPTEDVAVFVRTSIPLPRRKRIEDALAPFVGAITRTDSEEE